MYASADDWQRLGIEVERHLVPPQRARDAEYRATFPAFDVKGQAGTIDYAPSFHSQRIALPENSYRVSGNNSRYSNPEMDLAIERYFTTLPWEERMEWGRRIVQRVSEDVAWIGLYYEVAPVLIPNRAVNVAASRDEGIMLDVIHQWDLKP
jgi:ABC-type transport system substrate-binding protein